MLILHSDDADSQASFVAGNSACQRADAPRSNCPAGEMALWLAKLREY
jgi:hypothetical protein